MVKAIELRTQGKKTFVTEIEIRRVRVDQMILHLCVYNIGGLSDTAKELRETQRQLENNEITLEVFDEYWEEIKMVGKLVSDY